MANQSLMRDSSASDSAGVWASLKLAISNSSGFNRWKSELALDVLDKTPLDQLVRRYLRETLETLAY
ncbi:MAG: hypothetical protein AAF152_03625 [Cyanobacteria bacterium P01_A01_bin.114]